MSVLDIRFRAEGALLVLQVSKHERDVDRRYGPNSYITHGNGTQWVDASTEDLLEVGRLLETQKRGVAQENEF